MKYLFILFLTVNLTWALDSDHKWTFKSHGPASHSKAKVVNEGEDVTVCRALAISGTSGDAFEKNCEGVSESMDKLYAKGEAWNKKVCNAKKNSAFRFDGRTFFVKDAELLSEGKKKFMCHYELAAHSGKAVDPEDEESPEKDDEEAQGGEDHGTVY